jgi:hypothetical protein
MGSMLTVRPQLEHHHRPRGHPPRLSGRLVPLSQGRDSDVCYTSSLNHLHFRNLSPLSFESYGTLKRADKHLDTVSGDPPSSSRSPVATSCGVCFLLKRFNLPLLIQILYIAQVLTSLPAITFLAQWHPLIVPRRGDLRPDYASS